MPNSQPNTPNTNNRTEIDADTMDGVDVSPRYFQNVHTVLPEFDPVKNNITISLWINKIEEFGELYDWDEVAIKHYALSKLTGVAKTWRDSLSCQARSWAEWKTLLQETFAVQDSAISLRFEAQNYKWKPNQDIVEYYFEKMAKCNKCNMSVPETIEWIVHGLNDTRFRDYLGPLTRYDKLNQLLPDLKSGSIHIRRQAALCSKVGHYARDCPLKVNKSGGSNVSTTQASSSTSQTTNEAQGRSVLIIGSDNSHSKYFKDAFINNKQLRCYIDLGSSCVTIRDDIVTELGFSYYETDTQPLVGYGNGLVKPLGLFTGMLSIDDVSAKVKIHVVPKESQNIPLIVGHPYTEQPNIQITSKSNELKIEYCKDDMPVNESAPISRAVLKTDRDIIIPDNYLGHITTKSDLANFELCIEGGLREGHAIPRCVVQTDHEGYSIVPVMNVSGGDLTIPKGTNLTRADICKEANTEIIKREVNEEEILLDEINTELTGHDVQKLLDLLNEYKDVIARNMRQLGVTDKIKMKIHSEPILCVYNPHARTELHTDGSQVGLSGVLYQEQTDNKLHPISFYSRKTTPEESRYHSFELEALAIVNSVERFRVYLIGIHFVIRTDCNSLKFLEAKRDLNPRIGSINTVADSLSRYPVEEGKETELVGLPMLHIHMTTDWIAAMQRTNPEIVAISDKLEKGHAETHKKFTMCNRGGAFTSNIFEEFCDTFNIIHVKVAAGTPRGNGQIERLNKTILSCLSTSIDCSMDIKNDWDQKLFDVQWSLNTTVHRVIKCTPFELVFRHRGIGLHDNPLTMEIRELNQNRVSLTDDNKIEKVADLLESNRAKQAEYYNKHRAQAVKFLLGDLVMVENRIPSTGDSRKLEPKYRGPYEVTRVLDNDRYIVEDILGEQQSERLYKGILSHERLKLASRKKIWLVNRTNFYLMFVT
ncbi:hypothetical protein NQ314_011844 [Rhamnusium bicolor]|uniref:Integrase catalytic domain-containing protein n=1 Tax=Rhamnusium bicolor TaxID=1586634 RepID=A0AAV8XG89_9CUCU|nr:hypothetical protein NQ314_011844 [Rhamnusium bicolor]